MIKIATDHAVGAASVGSAVVASGVVSLGKCDIPRFSEYPLFLTNSFAFTIDDLFRTLATMATVVTIVYFTSKFWNR